MSDVVNGPWGPIIINANGTREYPLYRRGIPRLEYVRASTPMGECCAWAYQDFASGARPIDCFNVPDWMKRLTIKQLVEALTMGMEEGTEAAKRILRQLEEGPEALRYAWWWLQMAHLALFRGPVHAANVEAIV